MSGGVLRADETCNTATGAITVVDEKDPTTKERHLKATGPCKFLAPLVLAGGGRQPVNALAKCEAAVMLNSLESFNNSGLPENAFIVFGLNPELVKKIDQNFEAILKYANTLTLKAK
jgi:hypothetical protein